MAPLRILITVAHLNQRSGMVLHVRGLAMALARLGHTPIVYSPNRGPIAKELRAAMVSVPEPLDDIGEGIVKLSMIGLSDPQYAAIMTGLEPIILGDSRASCR
jgi:hypothetical protein